MDTVPVPRKHPAIRWVVVVVVAGFLLLAAFDACTGSLSSRESEIDTITLRVTGLKVGDGDPCNNLDPDKVLKSIIIREGETMVARVSILARDPEVLRMWGRHTRRCVFRFEQAVRVPNVDPAAVTITGGTVRPRHYPERSWTRT